MRRFAQTLIILTWLGLVLVPTTASAQATIAGTVKDTSGAVLPGVSVEVASAVLIEKVRSAVTDGTGQYRIIDLRPGTYTITFTLSGFSIVKREGIELTGVMTATVNTDLRVGTVSETIIVSGETPIVDVQSIRRQATVSGDVLNSLPTARGYAAIMTLIPAIILQPGLSNRDVQVTPGMVVFGGSGGREGGAFRWMASTSGLLSAAPGCRATLRTSRTPRRCPSPSGGLGEAEVGGPSEASSRTGGNTIKGVFGASWDGMVGSNYTQALKDAGLTAAGSCSNSGISVPQSAAPSQRPVVVARGHRRRSHRSVGHVCQPERGRPGQVDVCAGPDAAIPQCRELANHELAPHVASVGAKQVQRLLGRAASVQRGDLVREGRGVSPAADIGIHLRGHRDERAGDQQLHGQWSVSTCPTSVVVVASDQPSPPGGGLWNVSVPVWRESLAGQSRKESDSSV